MSMYIWEIAAAVEAIRKELGDYEVVNVTTRAGHVVIEGEDFRAWWNKTSGLKWVKRG